MRTPRTFAIIAVDENGVLSSAELRTIQDPIIQYLIVHDMIRTGYTYIENPVDADVTFGVKLLRGEPDQGVIITKVVASYARGSRPPSNVYLGAYYPMGGFYDEGRYYVYTPPVVYRRSGGRDYDHHRKDPNDDDSRLVYRRPPDREHRGNIQNRDDSSDHRRSGGKDYGNRKKDPNDDDSKLVYRRPPDREHQGNTQTRGTSSDHRRSTGHNPSSSGTSASSSTSSSSSPSSSSSSTSTSSSSSSSSSKSSSDSSSSSFPVMSRELPNGRRANEP